MPPGGHGHESLSQGAVTAYALAVAALVLGAGLMSGLTLGLLSLDILDLRVVEASGTARQAAAARKLLPLVQRPHWLLCTLLLANAACMEALPLFLDRLLDPVAALLLSVTAILLFGEVLPQAICSRFGIKIGAAFAPLVRVLMWLTSPVTWPLGKLLDAVLGHKEVAMQRQELKALVELHGERAGLGGRLTSQEVNLLSGAIDLRCKTALSAMTPLEKVSMLRESDVLDHALVARLLDGGHSRLPVCRASDPTDIVGLVLVKEVLQFWRSKQPPRVSQLTLRQLPRLPANTRLYDVLRLFQTGNSHMMLLVAPVGSSPVELRQNWSWLQSRDDDGSGAGAAANGSAEGSPRPDAVRSRRSVSQVLRSLLSRGSKAEQAAPEGEGNEEQQQKEQQQLQAQGDVQPLGSSGGGGGGGGGHIELSITTSIGGAPAAHNGDGAAGGADEARDVPIGIITLEDVLEELLQDEILDETDRYRDNEQTQMADLQGMVDALPPHLQALLRAEVVQAATALMRAAPRQTTTPVLPPSSAELRSAVRASTSGDGSGRDGIAALATVVTEGPDESPAPPRRSTTGGKSFKSVAISQQGSHSLPGSAGGGEPLGASDSGKGR